MNRSPLAGCLLGTALGDAIGLPCEGLTRRRAARFLPRPPHPLRHAFLFGRGMVSDDTEHACMTAQALIASGFEPAAFRRELASRMRWWLLGLPAGVGLATLRATLKLWFGFGAERSGVFSAGNGPAMRAAVLGAAAGENPALRELVKASTRLTHTDPKAERAALAVALASKAACGREAIDPEQFLRDLREALRGEEDELLELAARAVASARAGEETSAFADSIGLAHGVTGYAYHTVPVVLHAWFRFPRDFPQAVEAVVRCGGDTDTTAAIAGGIVGAGVGQEGLPAAWLAGLREWPRTVAWMEGLSECLERAARSGAPERPPRLPAGGVLARNLFFLAVVLLHGFRRLLPPY
ncbi:MAG: ADP-ribosylglycohydrolase family protein [Planctomycetes bacterium]|nr:ADP-ribosylglycohydrolase family protein [Planctomycetota bacterium]